MRTSLLMIGSFVLSLTAHADPLCPNLSGHYSCPATGNQAPLIFTLSQSEEPTFTRYTFQYDGWPSENADASTEGVLNAYDSGDTYIFCVDESLIYVKKQNDRGSIQQSFLSPEDEYVVKVRGKEIIRCPRVIENPTKP